MHIGVMKLVYIHKEHLNVSANHAVIFRDVKYTVHVPDFTSLKMATWLAKTRRSSFCI